MALPCSRSWAPRPDSRSTESPVGIKAAVLMGLAVFSLPELLMQSAHSGAKMINQKIDKTRRSAAQKLAPNTIRTSTVVRSLLAYLVNERWTEPYIIDLRCAEDGMLMAYESDSNAYLRLLCSRDELVRAVLTLAQLVNLTTSERNYLLAGLPSHSPWKTRNQIIQN